MSVGSLVELADEVAGGGEHDRVQPFAMIMLPRRRRPARCAWRGHRRAPTVVKVEPERLGLAVAQGARGGGCGGVEQLSRYLHQMRRDTLLGTVHGSLAAQLIKPQVRVLANDRGISCVTVDYDMLRGLDSAEDRLF
jgi:Endonuclease NucS